MKNNEVLEYWLGVLLVFLVMAFTGLFYGCGHNTGVLTLGTRAHIGVDPQNITADISYTDGLNIADISRENSSWSLEVDYVTGISIDKSGNIKGIKKIKRVIGPQMNGYLVELASNNPELAKSYVEAVGNYWKYQASLMQGDSGLSGRTDSAISTDCVDGSTGHRQQQR